LHTRSAHWISPNELRIAYIRFNDSNVPLYKFQVHGPPSNLYSSVHELPYPKVDFATDWFSQRVDYVSILPSFRRINKIVKCFFFF